MAVFEKCNHALEFHKECIRQWMETKTDANCPACREALTIPAEVHPPEPPKRKWRLRMLRETGEFMAFLIVDEGIDEEGFDELLARIQHDFIEFLCARNMRATPSARPLTERVQNLYNSESEEYEVRRKLTSNNYEDFQFGTAEGEVFAVIRLGHPIDVDGMTEVLSEIKTHFMEWLNDYDYQEAEAR